MIYILGRLLFPTMLHREKELRARLRWIGIVAAAGLALGVGGICYYLRNAEFGSSGIAKPLPEQKVIR